MTQKTGNEIVAEAYAAFEYWLEMVYPTLDPDREMDMPARIDAYDRWCEGMIILQLRQRMSRAEAARRMGLTLEKARFREAAAIRFLRHPRNKNHPNCVLLPTNERGTDAK